MSAKRRKTEQVPLGFVEPDKQEYYFTPPEVFRAILPHLRIFNPHMGGPRNFLDVGSGKGEIATVMQSAFPHAKAMGVEISEKRRAESQWFVKWDICLGADFMKLECFSREEEDKTTITPEIIVTNPWFSQWHAVVERCCNIVDPRGEVVAFGRVGTLEGVRGGDRARLWDVRAWDLFPLTWRPSCTGSGRDSASYMVAIFGPARTGKTTRLYRLPKDEP